MSVKDVANDIKTRSFKKLYYIYGEEEYLKQYYYREIKEKAVSALPELNTSEFVGKEFDLNALSEAVNAYPAMSERKFVGVVDIDNALLKKDFTAKLTAILKDIPDFCTVVFFDTELKDGSSNALEKVLSGCGAVCVNAEHPSAAGLASWVKRHFKSAGKQVSDADVSYLLDIADTDMQSLKNEIDKLCGVSGTSVTRADMDALVTRSIETDRFKIAEALSAGNYDAVTDILNKLRLGNVDDIAVAGILSRSFVDLWRARAAIDSQKTSSQLAQTFGMNPYGAAKVMRSAGKMKPEFLRKAVMLSQNLDAEMKSTPFNKQDLLINYIAEIIDAKQNG